jgi:hypothetical protein
VNTKGSNSFSNYYNAVNGYTEYISIVSLGFTLNELGLNLVVFVLSMGGVSAAS